MKKITSLRLPFTISGRMISFVDILFSLVFAWALIFSFVGTTGLTLQGMHFERHVIWIGGALVLISLWLIRGVLRGALELPRTPLDRPFIFLLLALGISAAMSADVWHSVWGFWERPGRGLLAYVSYIVYFYAVFHLIRIGRSGWVVGSLMAGVLVLSLWALGWFLSPLLPLGDVNAYKERYFQASSAAHIVVFLLPVLFGAIFGNLLKKDGGRQRSISIAIILTFVLAVLGAIGSTVSWQWTAAVVSLWLLLALLVSALRHPRASWFPMLVSFLVVCAVFLGGVLVSSEDISDVPVTHETKKQVAISALGDHFLSGLGPSLYGNAFSAFRPLDANQSDLVLMRVYKEPGLLYEVPATLGVLGGVAFGFLFLFAVGVALFRGYDGDEHSLHVWMGALISLLVSSVFVVVADADSGMLFVWFVVAALAIGLSRSYEERESVHTLSTRPSSEYALSAAFAALVIVGILLYAGVFVARVTVADMTARLASMTSLHDEAIGHLERSIELSPWEGRYPSYTARRYLGVLGMSDIDSEDARSIERAEGEINRTSEFATRGMDLMPSDPTAVEMAAQTYEALSLYVGSFAQVAAETYAEAATLEPHNPRLYSKRGEMIIRQAIDSQDPEEKKEILKEAKRSLETALSKKEEFPQAWYLLALTQEGLEEVDGAINSALRAAVFAPRDAGVLRLLARLYDTRGREGDFEKAKNLYEEAAKINEDDAASYYALAVMHKRENDPASALRYYSLALTRLSPENEDERTRIENERDDVLRSISGEDEEEEDTEDTEDTEAAEDTEDAGDIGNIEK